MPVDIAIFLGEFCSVLYSLSLYYLIFEIESFSWCLQEFLLFDVQEARDAGVDQLLFFLENSVQFKLISVSIML